MTQQVASPLYRAQAAPSSSSVDKGTAVWLMNEMRKLQRAFEAVSAELEALKEKVGGI